MGLIDGDVPGRRMDFGVSLMEGGKIGLGTGGTCWSTPTLKSRKRVHDDSWHHVAVTRNKDG